MNYKLIATDCDGTLLDSTGHIPDDNIKTLQKLNSLGHKIVLVTGRSAILAKDYIEQLQVTPMVIGCNGSSCINVLTGDINYVNPINKEAVKKVFDFCTKNNLPFKATTLTTCFTNDTLLYKSGLSSTLTRYTKKLKYSLAYTLVEDIFSIIPTNDIIKIVLVNSDEDILKSIQASLKKIGDIAVVRSARNCLDIICPNSSKGRAVEHYAKSLGIAKEDVIALGDSENDKSMLEYAGISIAMKNAEDEVKSIADIITDTNDNAGLAKALNNIFQL